MGTNTRIREPWQVSFAEFVGRHVISDIFEIDGREEYDYEPIWQSVSDPDSLSEPVWDECPYQIRRIIAPDFEPDRTFVLIHQTKGPVGFYADSQVWIDPPHRGRHLSTPLTLAAASYFGGSPVRDPGGASFSPAGFHAHKAAHRHAVLTAAKSGMPVSQAILGEYLRK